MFVDTHCHLYLKEFDEDRDEVIHRAESCGVGAFYLPGIDSSTTQAMLSLEKSFPDKCFAMMGLHPCSVDHQFEGELKAVEKWLSERPFCAIGEIGIDLYWDKTYVDEQLKAFSTQIEWAKELGIPIVIHSRESIDLIIEVLKKHKDNRLTGIFHCFTGNLVQARQIMDLGFLMGIGGVLTFKNAGLDKTVEEIPLEHLVLETDAPYLAPTPHRGKRNEPSYLKLVAEKLAQIKQVSPGFIADRTTANAKKIFKKNSFINTTL